MWCAKYDYDNGGNTKMLCPLSLGLAIGIVCFFGVFIWTLWVMHYGMPSMMVGMMRNIPSPTLMGGFVYALLALLKGFLFGFFVALLYDLFACCFACRKSDKGKKKK